MNLNFLNASRIMSNNEMQELSDKLRRGLQLAEKRLLEKNARNGKLLSQGTPDGKVIYVSATELLERLQEKEKESIKKYRVLEFIKNVRREETNYSNSAVFYQHYYVGGSGYSPSSSPQRNDLHEAGLACRTAMSHASSSPGKRLMLQQ